MFLLVGTHKAIDMIGSTCAAVIALQNGRHDHFVSAGAGFILSHYHQTMKEEGHTFRIRIVVSPAVR